MIAPEMLVAILVLAFATAIATNVVALPFAAFSSPVAIFILVVASLGAFRAYPAAGLALFLLTAVLFYKRNAATAAGAAGAAAYGDASIPAESMGTAVPYGSAMSQPRMYDQFKETDPANPMLGPIREGFATAGGIADEPEAFGAPSEAAPVGSYPIESSRPSAAGSAEPRDYVYRPAPDTGSNAFERFGPDMDEKKMAFGY